LLDAGKQVSLISGRDTALKGAQVSADKITATVGRDLTLQSLQDTDNYKSKQTDVSGGISFAIIGTGGSDSGTTSSAISNGTLNIRDPAKQQQDVATLSHDVEHANGSISPIFDKEKEQKRLRQVQLIADIGTQAVDIVRTQGQIDADKEARAELDKRGIKEPGKDAKKEEVEQYQQQLMATDAYQRIMADYGVGGNYPRVAQAVTAALQGLVGGDIGSAIAGASAPYMAQVIRKTTGDNAVLNTMAHAVLGAVVARAQGNSTGAGAAGAATVELIAHQLYPGKKTIELTEEERETVVALSGLAAGLAGGIAGGDLGGAVTGAKAGSNAVENNSLSDIAEALAERKTLEQKAEEHVKAENERYKEQNCAGMSTDACSAQCMPSVAKHLLIPWRVLQL